MCEQVLSLPLACLAEWHTSLKYWNRCDEFLLHRHNNKNNNWEAKAIELKIYEGLLAPVEQSTHEYDNGEISLFIRRVKRINSYGFGYRWDVRG